MEWGKTMKQNIMIQGTMSSAGKSLICAALCRIFTQDGFKTAPFKSQNMALNSFITEDGAEMGRAQVMQAEAAKIRPDARMNPILLKPTSDVGSQVIVNGHVLGNMPAASYFKYKKQLVPEIMKAYRSLEEEYDIIVIEGAGSPAEINLKKNDIVNMGMAKMVDAPVLLAGDIDRGGVFAQLYGTVALLEEEERKRVKGLIINKFRGDVEILKPGLATLEELTKIPVAGVIPWIYAKLDDEDSLAPRLSRVQAGAGVDIAVVRLPHISNFTDFNPLEQQPGISLRYAGDVKTLGQPDMVIVPGSKNTMSAGQTVEKGAVIGTTGNTGSSTGSHLHIECLYNGEYYNPLFYFDVGEGTLYGETPGGLPGNAIPPDAYDDAAVQALMEEAAKYLGYPYVWGGSSPSTSFDCSGFVCWVFTNSGVHNLPRTTAQGIYDQCTPVSASDAKAGDIIFFTGTYNSAGAVSHVGIYCGNGVMIHCGDPISYASINSPYWQSHFYSFGRLN